MKNELDETIAEELVKEADWIADIYGRECVPENTPFMMKCENNKLTVVTGKPSKGFSKFMRDYGPEQ